MPYIEPFCIEGSLKIESRNQEYYIEPFKLFSKREALAMFWNRAVESVCVCVLFWSLYLCIIYERIWNWNDLKTVGLTAVRLLKDFTKVFWLQSAVNRRHPKCKISNNANQANIKHASLRRAWDSNVPRGRPCSTCMTSFILSMLLWSNPREFKTRRFSRDCLVAELQRNIRLRRCLIVLMPLTELITRQ